jgi:hypothetical protein
MLLIHREHFQLELTLTSLLNIRVLTFITITRVFVVYAYWNELDEGG